MKKKLFLTVLVIVFTLCLCSCGSENESASDIKVSADTGTYLGHDNDGVQEFHTRLP